MSKMIIEVIEMVTKAKNKEERMAILQKHNSLSLRDLLRAGFDDTIEFILEDTSPEYKTDNQAPIGMSFSTLHKASPKLIYFVKNGKGMHMSKDRLQKMYVDYLSSLNTSEAEFLVNVCSKSMKGKYKGLTKKLVSDTWPKLLQDTVKTAKTA